MDKHLSMEKENSLKYNSLRIQGDFGLLIQNFRAILHATTHVGLLWCQ